MKVPFISILLHRITFHSLLHSSVMSIPVPILTIRRNACTPGCTSRIHPHLPNPYIRVYESGTPGCTNTQESAIKNQQNRLFKQIPISCNFRSTFLQETKREKKTATIAKTFISLWHCSVFFVLLQYYEDYRFN